MGGALGSGDGDIGHTAGICYGILRIPLVRGVEGFPGRADYAPLLQEGQGAGTLGIESGGDGFFIVLQRDVEVAVLVVIEGGIQHIHVGDILQKRLIQELTLLGRQIPDQVLVGIVYIAVAESLRVHIHTVQHHAAAEGLRFQHSPDGGEILIAQLVLPGEGSAVFQMVGDANGVPPPPVGVEVILGSTAGKVAVGLHNGVDLPRVGDFCRASVDAPMIDLHRLHLVGLGNAPLEAEYIRPNTQAQGYQSNAQGQQLRPELAKDSGRAGNEHLRADHARQAQGHDAGQQGRGVVGAVEHPRQHKAQAQAAQQTHRPPHHRAQRPEGQSVAGGLAAADTVEQGAGHQQHQSPDAVHQQALPGGGAQERAFT